MESLFKKLFDPESFKIVKTHNRYFLFWHNDENIIKQYIHIDFNSCFYQYLDDDIKNKDCFLSLNNNIKNKRGFWYQNKKWYKYPVEISETEYEYLCEVFEWSDDLDNFNYVYTDFYFNFYANNKALITDYNHDVRMLMNIHTHKWRFYLDSLGSFESLQKQYSKYILESNK